jgi:hypothetical protein
MVKSLRQTSGQGCLTLQGILIVVFDWTFTLGRAHVLPNCSLRANDYSGVHKPTMRGVLNSSERISNLESTDLDSPISIGKDQTRNSPKSTHEKGGTNASISHQGDSWVSASNTQSESREERGQDVPEPNQQPKFSPNDSLSTSGFHVFTWLNTGKLDHGASSLTIKARQLKEDLEIMDHFLSHKTSLGERISYRECPQTSRSTAYALLEEEARYISPSATVDQGAIESTKRTLERRVDIVNAAESIFQFFFPPTYKGPTVQKYWGALHQFLLVGIHL